MSQLVHTFVDCSTSSSGRPHDHLCSSASLFTHRYPWPQACPLTFGALTPTPPLSATNTPVLTTCVCSPFFLGWSCSRFLPVHREILRCHSCPVGARPLGVTNDTSTAESEWMFDGDTPRTAVWPLLQRGGVLVAVEQGGCCGGLVGGRLLHGAASQGHESAVPLSLT